MILFIFKIQDAVKFLTYPPRSLNKILLDHLDWELFSTYLNKNTIYKQDIHQADSNSQQHVTDLGHLVL